MPRLPVFLWCLFLGQASLRYQTYSLESLPSAVSTFISPSLSVVSPLCRPELLSDSVLISGDYLHPSNLSFLVAIQHVISFKRRAVAICFLAMFTFCVCPISVVICIAFSPLSICLGWSLVLSICFQKREQDASWSYEFMPLVPAEPMCLGNRTFTYPS